MPTAPPSRCLVTGCTDWAVARGRCAEHYTPWEQRSARNTNTDRRRARAFRSAVLRRDGVCRACGQRDAVEADHVRPVADGGARYDPANGQGLCAPCHDSKTRSENAARNRQRARG
ncbi:HNH endonuclease signature motif containing protein [Nocardioides nanhaiensis]|uniref:HNH nuclease domain-containing protein n=1 Tax=Nocardioides nanhaiensis TaxID=1476871 RepID=A0ABP8W4Q7_9ACTN